MLLLLLLLLFPSPYVSNQREQTEYDQAGIHLSSLSSIREQTVDSYQYFVYMYMYLFQ